MQTNTSPSLDEGGYILTNATTYTLFSPGITLTNIPTVITGIMVCLIISLIYIIVPRGNHWFNFKMV
jgi:hypothetical protein